MAKSYLVTVSAISKNSSGPLSYFSSTKIAPGTIVKVPLRNSFVLALVLSTRGVDSAKTEIRRAGFQLRKIRQHDILRAGLSSEILRALEETAHYYACSLGALVANLVPKVMLDEPEHFLKLVATKRKKRAPKTYQETLLFQMETEERFGQYRSLVRQCFARGASLMFVVPTRLDAERMRKELSHGIAEFVHLFTLTTKKSEMKKLWEAALTQTHPILFITTPAGLFFPRRDLDTIVVERENSRAYRTLSRPYIHLKFFIEHLAKKSQKQLVLGDSVLSLETLWRAKSAEYGEMSFIRWRLPASPTTLVDARSRVDESGKFEIISPELKNLLEKAVTEKERIFLFGARKGLAPTTVCGDCGTILPCLNCGAPVVLHRRNEATIYICHACGARRDSTTTCGYCGSWKLTPLGIGTQQIAREVRSLLPQQNIFILDKDSAPTDKQAESITKKFQLQGGILVGTELAFYYLDKVPYSGLVSVDALFSIPDFGINERIFYLVSRLREMTQRETVIQTRNIGKQILAWAAQGNIIDFYQSEIEERQTLLYPPFSIFIKISRPNDLRFRIQDLGVKFEKWQPDVLKDSLIIRVLRENWPDLELAKELALLPPSFSIKVDPESIL